MLKDLGIKTKLAIGFGAIVAIILALLLVAFTNFSKLSVASDWDRHTQEVLLEVAVIDNALLQVQSANRGFMLTGVEAIAAPLTAAETLTRKQMEKIGLLTRDNPAQQARIAKLRSLFDEWMHAVVEPLVAKRRALNKTVGMSVQAATLADIQGGTRQVNAMRQLILDITAEETRLLALRSSAAAELQHTMLLLFGIGGTACVLLAVVVGVILTKALLAPLNNLTHAVGRIAAGDQAARAPVLAADELGKVTVEFNRMAQAIADGQANELAATNLLRSKVDALLGVVSKAASGDLTGRIEVAGDDAIGQLGVDRIGGRDLSLIHI